MAYEKPLPNVTREDRPFWQAAREHRFVLPRCTNCGHVFFPPYLSCPRCLSFELEWMEASGKGTPSRASLANRARLPLAPRP